MARRACKRTGPTQFYVDKAVDEVKLFNEDPDGPQIASYSEPHLSRDLDDVFGKIDPRFIVWESARPSFDIPVEIENQNNVSLPDATNANLTESCFPLAACLNCNSCSSSLGTRQQCTAILFYLVRNTFLHNR
jgi:hypothetical protein